MLGHKTRNYLRRTRYSRLGIYFKVVCILAILLPSFGTFLRLSESENTTAGFLWDAGGKKIYYTTGGTGVYFTAVGTYFVVEPDSHFFFTHFTNPPDKEVVSKAKYGNLYMFGEYANNNLSKDAVILTTSLRSFHFSEMQMIWDGNKGMNQIWLQENLEDTLKILKTYNVTHIFIATNKNTAKIRAGMGYLDSPLIRNINNEEIFKTAWIGIENPRFQSDLIQAILYEVNYPLDNQTNWPL